MVRTNRSFYIQKMYPFPMRILFQEDEEGEDEEDEEEESMEDDEEYVFLFI